MDKEELKENTGKSTLNEEEIDAQTTESDDKNLETETKEDIL